VSSYFEFGWEEPLADLKAGCHGLREACVFGSIARLYAMPRIGNALGFRPNGFRRG
jgi:hypothetical protein